MRYIINELSDIFGIKKDELKFADNGDVYYQLDLNKWVLIYDLRNNKIMDIEGLFNQYIIDDMGYENAMFHAELLIDERYY